MAAMPTKQVFPCNDTLWRVFFDTVPFYVGTVSPTGVVLSINPGSIDASKVIGRRVTDVAPKAAPAFTDAIAAIIAGAEIAQADFPIPRTAGTRWISCYLMPLSTDGDLDSILVVGFDVTESRLAGAELRMTVNALHRLIEERDELASDVHDGILQSLYGIGLRLEAARGATGGDSPTNTHLDRAIAQLNETMADVRRFVTASRSSLAAHPRWDEAAAGVLRGLEVEGGPVLCVEFDRLAASRVPNASRGEIVFIAREAVSNAIRHAGAKRIAVRIINRGNGVRLEVEDDGCGYRTAATPTGLGLLSMTRRAGRIGAILTIETDPGTGTLVRLDLACEGESH